METLHECRVCRVKQPEDNFFRASKNQGQYVDRICKPCKNERIQVYRRTFKQWCVDYKGGKCIVCGYDRCMNAMDFHHFDPSQKEFGFGKRDFIRSSEEIKQELDKCVLLCKNCHAETHAGLHPDLIATN